MPESPRPLVALVGATASAIPPAEEAFAEWFPEATVWNVLDDRLIIEALDAGGLTPPLVERMSALISYALAGGASGVLLTCSMYGPVAHEFGGENVPVLASDDAAFAAAAAGNFSHLALLASLPVPLADARERLDASLPGGRGPQVTNVLAPGAFELSSAGDPSALSDALAAAVRDMRTTPDAVLLAQYSLAPAASRLEESLGIPVISGPARAAVAMRKAMGSSS